MENREYISEDVLASGSDFLAHHGVLGMKWGIRKDGKPQGWQGGSSGYKKKFKNKKFKDVGTSNKKLIDATLQTDKYDDALHKKLEEIDLKSSEAADRGEPLWDKDYAKEWTNAYLDYHDKSIKAYEKVNDDELNKEDKEFKEAMLKYHRESIDYWKNDYNKNWEPDNYKIKAPKDNKWKVDSQKFYNKLNELDSAQSVASRKTSELNNKYEGKLRTPEQRKAYMNERDKITKEHYDKSISELKSIKDSDLSRNDRKVKNNLIKNLEREKEYELTWDSSWNEYAIDWPALGHSQKDLMEMNDNEDHISHSIDVGNEFLMHYGVKGMKWHKHLKAKEVSNAFNKGVNETLEYESKAHHFTVGALKAKADQVSGSIYRRKLNDRRAQAARTSGVISKTALKRYGRNAVYKGLKPEAKKKFQRAEQTRVRRQERAATLRMAKGYAKINKFFGVKNVSAKNKKAATKFWKENRDAFYESL